MLKIALTYTKNKTHQQYKQGGSHQSIQKTVSIQEYIQSEQRHFLIYGYCKYAFEVVKPLNFQQMYQGCIDLLIEVRLGSVGQSF